MEVVQRCESLTDQLSTLKLTFDEQLQKQALADDIIQSQQEKIAAFEQKT